MNNAINYMMKSGGLVKEEEYPYKGVDGTCKVMAANEMAAAVGSYLVVSTEEQQIEANLVKYGPLAGQHQWIYSVFHSDSCVVDIYTDSILLNCSFHAETYGCHCESVECIMLTAISCGMMWQSPSTLHGCRPM